MTTIKLKGTFSLPDRLALALFVIYLIFGLSIVGDFGVNWDDAAQRLNGQNNVEYLFHQHKEPLRQSVDRYHGPAFEIVLIALENLLHRSNPHQVYLMRHTAVFIYGALCLIAFYFVIRRLFLNQWLPLVGCLIFVVQPRVFADSFYNPKDITVMGGMIIGMLTLILLSERLSWRYLIIHAFICAWCTDIRVINAMLPLATIGILIYKGILINRIPAGMVLLKTACFIALTFAFMISMWPILMDGPIYQLSSAIAQMSHYTEWDKTNLYFGKDYKGDETPGEYQFVWFFMTTPVIYSLLFLFGIGLLLKAFFIRPASFNQYLFIWLSLAFFILPPAAMWFSHSVVLEGWRHVFMIYPFFVLVIVFALDQISKLKVLIKRLVYFILASCLIFNVGMLVYLHPFEYVYFNPMAVKCLAPLDRNFEIDYWGPSSKQGLDYILHHCYHGTPVKIAISNKPVLYNYDFMPEADKSKIILSDPGDADYYLSFHRWDWAPQPDSKLVYEFRRQGNRIMSIYKLR